MNYIYEVAYWTNGDRHVTRTVTAESAQAARRILADDEQEPLAQVDYIAIVGPALSDAAAATVKQIEHPEREE